MERIRRIKNSRQTVYRWKKNSHNRPLKNKTIPENVHRGTNNFPKSSVEEQIILQIIRHFYNKHVEMFKTIYIYNGHVSDIQHLEHSYRWKYGTINLKSCKPNIYKKNPIHPIGSPTLRGRRSDTIGFTDRWLSDTLPSDIRHPTVRDPTLKGWICETLGVEYAKL